MDICNFYGLEALDKIYKIFKTNNVNIWFEYGTLLGAYREKGFIPYDYDIDLGMYSEDYTPELERELFDAGFSIKRMFYKVENLHPSTKCLTEISLDYKGLQIDVFMATIGRKMKIELAMFIHSAGCIENSQARYGAIP